MKAKIELNLKPFSVPNFVVYDGFAAGSQKDSVPIELLAEETLEQMCREFVTSVYKKAGKKNPPMFISKG
jgi:hypothetical protein